MTQYSSRLNRILELSSADESAGAFHALASQMPHYLVDISVLRMFDADFGKRKDREVCLSDFSSLPYDEFLLETVGGERGSSLTLCSSTRLEGWFLFRQAWVFADGDARIDPHVVVPVRHEAKNLYQFGGLLQDGPVFTLDKQQLKEAGHGTMVINAFLFGLSVKGVAQEKVEAPEKLNKARARKGKPPIREFTVMKIGQVYDKSGKAHAYTGRTMPVHLRAGHSRRQHYGRGNQLVKTVQIPPTIVNFTPGAEVKMPKRVLTVGQNVEHLVRKM